MTDAPANWLLTHRLRDLATRLGAVATTDQIEMFDLARLDGFDNLVGNAQNRAVVKAKRGFTPLVFRQRRALLGHLDD